MKLKTAIYIAIFGSLLLLAQELMPLLGIRFHSPLPYYLCGAVGRLCYLIFFIALLTGGTKSEQ